MDAQGSSLCVPLDLPDVYIISHSMDYIGAEGRSALLSATEDFWGLGGRRSDCGQSVSF